MRNVIFYIGIVLLTIYVEIMYMDFYGVTLLAFELLLFAAMFLTAWYFKRRISVTLETEETAVHKDEEILLRFGIWNRGFLPVTKMRFCILAENKSTKEKEKIFLSEGILPKKKKQAVIHAAASCCGVYGFRLEKGAVWDYLGMFSRKVVWKEELSVCVLPGFWRMDVKMSERTRNFPVDGDEYDPHRSGDDPSEIFQVREFRDGDTLQRVHWKLSAKADGLMTKELGRPLGCKVLVFLDLYAQKGEEKEQDAFFELAAAALFSLQQEGVQYCAAWLEKESGQIYRCRVRNEEQVYETVQRLLKSEMYSAQEDLAYLYQQSYPQESYSSVVYVDGRPGISVGGKEATVFDREHLREQISGYLLEV